jgi:hypothetical protein
MAFFLEKVLCVHSGIGPAAGGLSGKFPRSSGRRNRPKSNREIPF